jgi:hypothetical protein
VGGRPLDRHTRRGYALGVPETSLSSRLFRAYMTADYGFKLVQSASAGVAPPCQWPQGTGEKLKSRLLEFKAL